MATMVVGVGGDVIGDLDFFELDWPTRLDDGALARLPEAFALPPTPGELFAELCTNMAVTLVYFVALFALVRIAGTY